ncbi:MAG: alkaline shock response membrane anchor protein AmaP [Syntrophomonadaceae bacterium]|nr:alkaline shock response membrane anchor protein AmaP [Syntrophomonadaceae bacterium]
MTGAWRVVLFFYSLLLAAAGALALVLAMGRTEFTDYFTMLMSNSQNRLVIASVAAILLVAAIVTLFYSLKSGKSEPKATTVIVNEGIDGQVSMTIPAIKVIIMKAVKKVEGIKEIKATVNSKPEGLDVLLHTMINPDYNVPEMSERIQTAVRQQLEATGGLKVSSIRVLIDDLGSAARQSGH